MNDPRKKALYIAFAGLLLVQSGCAMSPTSQAAKSTQYSRLVLYSSPRCSDCRRALDELEAYTQAQPTLPILVVLSYTQPAAANDYLAQYQLDPQRFEIIIDPQGALARSQGVETLPELRVLDERARVAHRQVGLPARWNRILGMISLE